MNKIADIKIFAGSVEHYSHFMYGFIFPLIEYLEETDLTDVDKVFVRRCGLFDRMLDELAFDKVTLLDKTLHELYKQNSPANIVELVGYDNWITRFDTTTFKKIAALIKLKLTDSIEINRQAIIKKNNGLVPSVVFINRGRPHAFFISEQSENKESGTQRRSIPNFDECVTAVSSLVGPIYTDYLEDKSLAYQIALFSMPNLVIMQHGAAASNVAFMQETATLVEIIPADLNPPKLNKSNPVSVRLDIAVTNLSNTFNVSHYSMGQSSSHSPVDTTELLQLVQRILDAS